MRRRMLNLLAGLSLLVCLSGIVSWGRSYGVGDAVYVTRGLRSVSVTSARVPASNAGSTVETGESEDAEGWCPSSSQVFIG